MYRHRQKHRPKWDQHSLINESKVSVKVSGQLECQGKIHDEETYTLVHPTWWEHASRTEKTKRSTARKKETKKVQQRQGKFKLKDNNEHIKIHCPNQINRAVCVYKSKNKMSTNMHWELKHGINKIWGNLSRSYFKGQQNSNICVYLFEMLWFWPNAVELYIIATP